MTTRRISTPAQLRDLAAELGVRPDWHEPGFEMWVRLYKDGQPVADVNLATLFAWAARDGHGGDSL